MATWGERAYVGKIQILCDQKASVLFGYIPDDSIIFSGQTFIYSCITIVPGRRERILQAGGNILVQFDFHATAGKGGIGMSSSAQAAANAITALTASSVRVG